MKAEALIRDALQELGKAAAEQPVEPDAFRTGVRYANQIGAEYAYLDLPWDEISVASDEVSWPGYAHNWLIKTLALRLAPQFAPGEDVSMIMRGQREAYHNMLVNHRKIIPSSYPSILPIGSGNECYEDLRFYPIGCSRNPDQN